ncbi:MAG TPA: class I SAM-dependent methyltransferase [Candidatus Saccharimonadales bacterium]|nr:class I SAM-dependent methyltransferase [Candidatus Saccharimonadales bacterium]
MSENLYLYSLSTFRELIVEALRVAGASRIVEVGSEYGKFTETLCAYAQSVGGKLTSIDPYPQAAAMEFVAAHQGQPYFEFIQKTSHAALADLPQADAYVVDGDPNYFTVLGELELIHKSRGAAPWLVFQHNVCWPCARRDMYYQPDKIPIDHRQPHSAAKGLILDHPAMVELGMRTDGKIAWALQEGGPANGVRTAIEDFLARHPELRLDVVPGVLGLGIIYSRKAEWAEKMTALLEPLAGNPLIERMERNRWQLQMRVCELEHQVRALTHPVVAKPAVPQLSAKELRRQAESLLQKKDWLEAGKFYQVLCRRFPDDVTLWQNRLECLRQAGQKVMVRLLYKDALKAHPDWCDLLAGYAPETAAAKAVAGFAMA